MTETTSPTTNKAPTHFVYHVRERQTGKAFWTRLGAAWPHADGHGFNLQIECLPLDGRLALRIATEAKD